MTTSVITDYIRHSTDSDFRAWFGNIHNALLSVGMVQTSDTGQASPLTATRPAVNTYVYCVYRFNDTLQGTSPIFLKIEYGTSTSSTFPNVRATIGSSSDGAGNIGGATTILQKGFAVANGNPITSTPLQSNVCCVDGYLCLAIGLGGVNANVWAFLCIGRSVNSSGNPSSDGIFVAAGPVSTLSAITYYTVRLSLSTIYQMTNGSSSLVCGGLTSSTVSDGFQAFKHYITLPRVRPVPWLQTVLSAEAGNNVQFKIKPIGGLERNYISLGSAGYTSSTFVVALPASSAHTLAMLWE